MNKIIYILTFLLLGTAYIHANQGGGEKEAKTNPHKNTVKSDSNKDHKESTKKTATKENLPTHENKKEAQAIYFKSKYLWYSKSMSEGLKVEVYLGYTTPIITKGIGDLDYVVPGNKSVVSATFARKGQISGEFFLQALSVGKTNLFIKFKNGKYFNLNIEVIEKKEDSDPLPFYALDELVQMGAERDSLYSKSNMIKVVENYDTMKERGLLQGIHVHRKRFNFPSVKTDNLDITLFECFTFQKENGKVHQIFTFAVKNDSNEWLKVIRNQASLLAGSKNITKHESLDNFDEVIPDAMQLDHHTLKPSQMTTGLVFVEDTPLHVNANNFKLFLSSKKEKVTKFNDIKGLEAE